MLANKCPVGYSYDKSYKNNGGKIQTIASVSTIRVCMKKCNSYCDDNSCNEGPNYEKCRAFGYSYTTKECLLFSATLDSDTETSGDHLYCTKSKF